ncbi:uncharacterized protein LOC113301180 [Papaver somniferum]|uniref:uncharacterized protein LOC113301180 n=1 Tax=Papaver somniferum TaxID=3469 RepID=UPI000E6F73D0|nr:uncharacterized protein LOC113301180 [Papaver somniferum]
MSTVDLVLLLKCMRCRLTPSRLSTFLKGCCSIFMTYGLGSASVRRVGACQVTRNSTRWKQNSLVRHSWYQSGSGSYGTVQLELTGLPLLRRLKVPRTRNKKFSRCCGLSLDY